MSFPLFQFKIYKSTAIFACILWKIVSILQSLKNNRYHHSCPKNKAGEVNFHPFFLFPNWLLFLSVTWWCLLALVGIGPTSFLPGAMFNFEFGTYCILTAMWLLFSSFQLIVVFIGLLVMSVCVGRGVACILFSMVPSQSFDYVLVCYFWLYNGFKAGSPVDLSLLLYF